MKKLKEMSIGEMERFYFNKIDDLFYKIGMFGILLITFFPPPIMMYLEKSFWPLILYLITPIIAIFYFFILSFISDTIYKMLMRYARKNNKY